MRFGSAPLWLAILHLAPLGVPATSPPFLRPRDYDSRDYYALHLAGDVSLADVAEQLWLDYEGPIGELDGHHLFSAPRNKEDVVALHLDAYRRRKRDEKAAGNGALAGRDLSDGILFAEKQKLKKLVKRIPPPERDMPRGSPPAIDNSGLLELQRIIQTLDIKDPIFNEQWHLVSLSSSRRL